MINIRIEHQRDVRLKHFTQSELSKHNIETSNTDWQSDYNSHYYIIFLKKVGQEGYRDTETSR